jgi:hypothetical protein
MIPLLFAAYALFTFRRIVNTYYENLPTESLKILSEFESLDDYISVYYDRSPTLEMKRDR